MIYRHWYGFHDRTSRGLMSTPMPWVSEDPLTEALFQLRMRGAFYSWTEAAGSGALDMPQFPDTLSFHIVARGTAYLEVDGEDPRRLDQGRLALVPRGIGHRVSTEPGAVVLGRADELPQTMLGDAFSVLRVGPGDVPADLAILCGVVAFDSPAVHDMLAVLPPIIEVDSARHPVMAALLPLLAGELRDPRPGGEAVATRLADVLVVETVRAWLADEPDAASGWLAALRDPQLGAAIAAIHREPGSSWTLPATRPIGVDVAVGFRRPVRCRRRDTADGVRARLAHEGRARDARLRAHRGFGRRGARLRLRGGLQSSVRADHREHARPDPSCRRCLKNFYSRE
jgi:hypothetical protein